MIVINILIFMICVPLFLLGLAYIYLALRPWIKKAVPSLNFPQFPPLQALFKKN